MIDVVLSFMALRSIGWGEPAPVVLHVPGYVPLGSKAHPTWGRTLDPLRASSGRLLPNLIDKYKRFVGAGYADVGRIAAVGFSAGANNGLRHLLRNAEDRERIDAVVSIDGLHPNIRRAIDLGGENAAGAVIDWSKDMGPFDEYALRAARGEALGVWTASSITINRTDVASTKDAIALLAGSVAEAYPDRIRVDQLGLVDPAPDATVAIGDFGAAWYRGTDAEAHRVQARRVLPDVLQALLEPRWFPRVAAGEARSSWRSTTLLDVPAYLEPSQHDETTRGASFGRAVPPLAALGGAAAAAFPG